MTPSRGGSYVMDILNKGKLDVLNRPQSSDCRRLGSDVGVPDNNTHIYTHRQKQGG